MTEKPKLSALFVNHAADILGDTERGLFGAEIVRLLPAYAIDENVEIPHSTYPFEAGNKRTALAENILPFPEKVQYRIILELCDHPTIQSRCPDEAKALKVKLMTKYGHLSDLALGEEVNQELIEQTRSWLGPFPEVLAVFNQALQKYEARSFLRNVLDDLRLALEKLLRQVLANNKSLENQIAPLGVFVKERGGSSEFCNMFVKLLDYYSKYQNEYVKHDDGVIEEELEFIIEITSTFMKHLVRISGSETPSN